LIKDPLLRTIGLGTRIFLCGAVGYVAWEGTQHNPSVERDKGTNIPYSPSATLALIGDLKNMSADYLRAASFQGYGITLFVGVGVPIPVLDEELAASLCVATRIFTPRFWITACRKESGPNLAGSVTPSCRSGEIELEGKKVRTASLSSYAKARDIAAAAEKLDRSAQVLPAGADTGNPDDRTIKPLDETDL